MMKLEDALFNWLQIRLVADARPQDHAALDTVEFFHTILIEDHLVRELQITEAGDDMLQVRYTIGEQSHVKSYDRHYAEQLLQDINDNPKYNE